jgi:hypothetical protein
MTSCRWAVLSLAMTLTWAPASLAAEGDLSSGLGLSLPVATPDFKKTPFLDVGVERGLGEVVQIGAEMSVAQDFAAGELRLLQFAPLVGVKFDVLQWVPYAASGPVFMTHLQPLRFDVGGTMVLGVDYLLGRSLSLGGHYHFVASAGEGGALLHRVGLRMMYHWGW